nr:hypothetical protein [Tanacetum cinerariifolium]
MRVLQVNQQVKAVTLNCETCGGPHSYNDFPVTVGQTQNEDLKGITTRSGTAYQGPTVPTTSSSLSQVVERETEVTKDTVPPTNNESTKDVQPMVVQTETPILNYEPIVAPIIEPVVAPINSLILKPKFSPSIKILLTNKDKLFELARTPLNEHCSAILLKSPGRSRRKLKSHAIVRVEKLSLPELTPTLMTLELVDWSIIRPIGVAEDVYVKVGKFHFPADFIVGDFDADPRVPLILRRSFLKTERALIDVFEGELTLRVGRETITFNLDQTSRYSPNYSDMTANRIDVIDMAFDDFLALEDDATLPEVDQSYYDPEGDILLLEAFLNDDPSLPPPTQGNYLPEDLPPYLEYAFLEGDDKLPVIIVKDLSDEEKATLITVLKSHKRVIAWKLSDIKDLSDEEKAALITVLKSHKRVIAWKLSDIKGIDPEFCTHKILIEDDFEPPVQHQRRVNPKIHDVIKKEVLKLLDAGLIYPISDSPWIARPITRLLEKDTSFFFSKSCVGAFQTLKRKLTKASILIAPDWDLPLELMCDASDFAIGAVLGQRQEKHFRPIHYASKTMTEAKSNYTTTEK